MNERVKRCLDGGMSILVGSVDGAGMPSCCRAVALTSADGLATITAYVPVATSQDTIANVAGTRRMAVVVSHPIDHCSTQLKGTTTSVRLARDDEAALVQGQLDQFAEVLATIGVPRRVTGRVAHWPAFAIEMRVEEMYEQTPGPKAGSRLQ
jgi:hypothetical protein